MRAWKQSTQAHSNSTSAWTGTQVARVGGQWQYVLVLGLKRLLILAPVLLSDLQLLLLRLLEDTRWVKIVVIFVL